MSDPSKSKEMKERWRDPEYRARMALTLQQAAEKHAANTRSCAEAGYRLSGKRQRGSPNIAAAPENPPISMSP